MPQFSSIVVLKKRPEFLAVAAVRKRWVTPAFILQKAPRPDGDAQDQQTLCGFGLTASKKMIGNAVMRNRARRRLRALVREVLPTLPVAGLNFVLIARKDILTRDYAALRKDLLWAMKRLDVKLA